jgi:hypothetical protein
MKNKPPLLPALAPVILSEALQGRSRRTGLANVSGLIVINLLVNARPVLRLRAFGAPLRMTGGREAGADSDNLRLVEVHP